MFLGVYSVHKKLFNVLYVLNIVFQAIFTLLTPALFFGFIAWLLNTRAGLERWIFAPFIIVGVLIGFYSMIKFTISAMSGLERLEKEQNSDDGGNKK